jgi:hypothetical protein
MMLHRGLLMKTMEIGLFIIVYHTVSAKKTAGIQMIQVEVTLGQLLADFHGDRPGAKLSL